MKLKCILFVLVVFCSGLVNTTFAAEAATKALTETRAFEIQHRVSEIKAMNFSGLNKVQRKDLRHELKDMKTELRAADPGVIYISTGAIILIIILLIILL